MAFFQPAPVPALGRVALKRLARQSLQISSSSSLLLSPYSSHSYSTSTAAKTTLVSHFVCRQCLVQPPKTSSRPPSSPSMLSSVARSQTAQQFRNPFAPFARCLSNSSANAKKATAPSPPLDSKLGPDAETETKTKTNGKTNGKTSRQRKREPHEPRDGYWAAVTSKSVAYWLLGSAASVFGIVVFGGLTRLTESGLSITEWRPVTGSVPPLSAEDWESEFAKYRASPEYAKLNPHMDLDEFKKIYFMEWTHRLWGRLIGVTFVLPAIYFIARRRVTRRMAKNLVGISALIGFQGVIGWWMVSSGLKDDLFADGAHPRVSQYRLTTHLATAFVCYSWMLVAGLMVLRTHRLINIDKPRTVFRLAETLGSKRLRPFRRAANALTVLIFATTLTGALVAGLDAGLIYNEFPMMGLGLTPPASELWDRFYSRREDGADLWWRNMLENPSLVQLDHRIMATLVFTSVLALFAYSRGRRVSAVLPPDARKATLGLVHLMLMQVTLGYLTLVYMVPTHLAAAHQAGALALLSGALVLGTRLRIPRGRVMQLVQKVKNTRK